MGRLSNLRPLNSAKVNIQIVTPAPLGFNNGNKITALRWVRLLRRLGHKVAVSQFYSGQRCDLLIALHARRSGESIRRFNDQHKDRPIIVVLTGTDLYRDIRTHRQAQRSLDIATRIVALQRNALTELPKRLHSKTRIIYQSAEPFSAAPVRWDGPHFKLSVIGHLRAEKDPLRTALAIRKLPPDSRINVVHVGRSLDSRLEARARAEEKSNSRYRWIGELPHWRTRRVLASSHLTVIPSRMEGSSNVLSEALASSIPVIASKISGLIGTLGENYPGFFPVGNTAQLTILLQRAESERAFYDLLKRSCARVAPLVDPARERRAWSDLLAEFETTNDVPVSPPESMAEPRAKERKQALIAGKSKRNNHRSHISPLLTR